MARLDFTVAGGGLAGALMATYLARAGHSVEVFERRPDVRRGGVGRGRSINLALSTRGLHALSEVGLADAILQLAIPMRGRMMHGVDGSLTFQPYSKNEREAIHSVSRAALNLALLEAAAAHPAVQLNFEYRCDAVDVATGRARFVHSDGIETRQSEGELLIGADGAYSAVRGAMLKRERFDYHQEYQAHGYKELTMPARDDGAFAMAEHALHIWPRGEFMMIGLPNLDRSFTCTIFWPLEGEHGFAAFAGTGDEPRQRLRAHFVRHFPDALELMPTFVEDFFANPLGSLVTMRCGPWYVSDKVVLLGDAAHAVVPFYGQGMNAAFEDCSVLMQELAQHGAERGRALRHFYELRKPHVDALATLAVGNFFEMRDHVASRAFLLGKWLERQLHRLLPGFTPLYSMVTFSRLPYADAVKRARRQDGLLRGVAVALLATLLAGIGIWLGS